MAMSSAEKYWITRRFWEDFYRAKRENKTLDQLKSVFDNAVNEVLEKLEKQADLHKMTAGELLEDFYGRKQKEYYKYINENYEKLMSDDKAYKQFIDEFFPAYDYAKVNRLLKIRSQIFSILAEHGIKADVNGKFSNSLKNEVENTYKSNIQLVNALTGSNQSYKIDLKELERIINYPWSGKSFSTRLWGNVSKLEQDLSGAFLESYIQGTGMDGALKSMKSKYDRSFFKNLERLVRTEYNHFGQEAIHESYKARGIKEYEILTAEDERVCIVCGKMHGQTFKEKERSVGKNCAPFHARCRCTDIPKLPDLPDDIDEIYESMFGNLLDDFAKNEFGINPKSLHVVNGSKSGYNEIKDIAKMINANVGSPMSVVEADRSNANPRYYESRDYQVNCQRCVPTYEMRRRGINAEAMSAKDNSIWDDQYCNVVHFGNIGIRGINAFVDPTTKEPVIPTLVGGKTMKQNYAKLEALVREGERYSLSVAWQRSGAHIVNMERIDGILYIVDAQSGVIAPIEEYFAIRKAKPASLNYLRIDNLEFNKEIIKKIAFGKEGEENG